MRTYFLLSFCCAALFSACSLYYAAIRVDSKFFSDDQKRLLDQVNAVSGYAVGYDEDLNLDYFFVKNQGMVNGKTVDRDVAAVLKSTGENNSIGLFERILYLHELTLYVMEYYKKIEYWSGYTYIDKYLLPSLINYETLLQKNIYSLYSYRDTEAKRKEFAEKASIELRGYWNVDLWQTVR